MIESMSEDNLPRCELIIKPIFIKNVLHWSRQSRHTKYFCARTKVRDGLSICKSDIGTYLKDNWQVHPLLVSSCLFEPKHSSLKMVG